MSKIFKTVQNNNSFLFVVVLFAFLSSTTVFGQNESLKVSTEEVTTNHDNVVIETPVKDSNSAMINSNVNFILWFMGTKEDMGRNFSQENLYSKKSFMTSGREPNHLLVKTLLKKALNIKSC
ncbi:hypothetical protein [Flavobacterium aquicola]|uniref:Uncharacterized protein n=1 Tax=Flavobacterium aquicola TaxID=1682742 RepID=A0A3E0EK37_9FLAO|nr:hypothetical protein [Flavobacterium aquicola]REG98541.1 hypothetical protein C8P67_106142 [Flavobacterium aquicola]